MCAKNSNSFHDTIAEICFKQFDTLSKTGKPKENEWTILSCILLENEGKFEVVALGTGTKCIGHDKMSKDGDILNDSHAEVICRRVFLRYIYENLLQKSNKFTYNSEEKKFKIKEGIKFHFFSTHVPCGDAAIFAKHDAEDVGDLIIDTKKEPVQSKRKGSYCDNDNKKIKLENEKGDIFRTGAKCLESDVKQDLQEEGANYHITGVVRTKPGRGVPTLSVSCSDKLARWCHLGIQGALLAILLSSPIYFSSVTFSGGTPFNEEAMKRALFRRLGNVDLHPPFGRNEIILGQASLTFSYTKSSEKNPCPASIAWLKADVERQTEVSVDGRRQGVTKKQIKSAGALRICKLELFKKFIQIIEQFDIKLNDVNNLNESTYKQAKLYSTNYQNCWSILQKNFKVWTVKDENLEKFSLC